MIICHLFEFEIQAVRYLKEYEAENYDDIAKVDMGKHKIIMKDKNIHEFMGISKYCKWCKGRTYMLNGKIYHSGYELKEGGADENHTES